MNSYQRFGWVMFLLSGVVFLIVGIRASDPLTVAGAVVWMIGCGAFLMDRDS